jgi:hypothetical protein
MLSMDALIRANGFIFVRRKVLGCFAPRLVALAAWGLSGIACITLRFGRSLTIFSRALRLKIVKQVSRNELFYPFLILSTSQLEKLEIARAANPRFSAVYRVKRYDTTTDHHFFGGD